MFTESLAQMLAEAENITVVGTAVSPSTAITAVAKAFPDIIIVANAGDQPQANFNPLLSCAGYLSYPPKTVITQMGYLEGVCDQFCVDE